MEHNDQNIQSEGFDANRVSYLLDSADLAEQDGNYRLAIHLYCAAFEASQENEDGIDERTLDGLRQAWSLACQQGDRATAETIFNDLIPYNTDEQTQHALAELQEMAVEELGIKKSDMEDMAIALADGIRDAGIDFSQLAEQLGDFPEIAEGKVNFANLASSLFGDSLQASLGSFNEQTALDIPGTDSGELEANGQQASLRYAQMEGFEKAKEKMRKFGIIDPADTEMQGFLQQAESFHGVSGPVLTQNFLFVSPSREDSGIFAQATAQEIGWPVVTMIVDVNEFGDGTIKIAAPVKRSFFGPPRVTDFPNPCTLVIQNIDILQDLFWGEEQAMNKGCGPYGCKHAEDASKPTDGARTAGASSHMGSAMGGMAGMGGYPQRSLQHEIVGYLGALFARGGVFVIATSAASTESQPLVMSEQLESLLGRPVEIAVDLPTFEERHRVLTSFSQEHPSFHDLDLTSIARLSEGMSRYDLVFSCRQAVEYAYSESLRTQCHKMVELEDVLSQFTQYLPHDSAAYRMVEDYLVAVFTADLETEILQTGLNPDQIILDFEDEECQGDV